MGAIWYVYPMLRRLSFTVISIRHIQELERKFRVQEIDEDAFPIIVPHSRPIVFLHPFFYPMAKYGRMIAKKIYKYGALIGVDVADSNHISPLAVSMTNYATAMIVPSNFARQAYLRSGVKVPVYVVPHGVSNEYFKPRTRDWGFLERYVRLKEKRGYIYLLHCVYHSDYRKGTDLVLKFYVELKKERRNVVLVLRTLTPNGPIQNIVRRFGGLIISGWMKNEDQIPIYDMCDIYLNFARGGGFELCLTPDEIVITEEGVKAIKDVKVGENVLTHKGEFKKVTKIYILPYNGEIVKIYCRCMGNIPIELTPNHPVLTLRTSKYKTRKREYVLSEKPVWVKAEEIKKGDCILIPIPKQKYDNIVFDLTEYVKEDIEKNIIKYDEQYIYYYRTGSPRFTKISYTDIQKATGETKKIVCKAVKCYLNCKETKSKRVEKVLEFLKEVQYRPTYSKIKRYVKLDERLAKIIGYYLAEGSINENNWTIEISFGNEEELVKDCVKLINEVFEYTPNIYKYSDKHATKVVVCNKVIAKFLLTICNKLARNKKIPKEILWGNRNVLSWCLWAMILGDGYVRGNKIEYTTVSKKLAYGMFLGLLRLGYKPHMRRRKDGKTIDIEIVYPDGEIKKTPHINPLRPRKQDYILHNNKSWFSTDKKYLILPVKKIEKTKYRGFVYNLEVEEDHTYTANLIAVHNCPLEAMVRGEIPIAGKGGSWEDYTPDWCLVPTRPCPYVLKDNPIHDGGGVEVIVERAVDKACEIIDDLNEYKAKIREYVDKVVRKRFTWKRVGDMLIKIVEKYM